MASTLARRWSCVAESAASLGECGHLLVYLTTRTWSSGELSLRFAAEVQRVRAAEDLAEVAEVPVGDVRDEVRAAERRGLGVEHLARVAEAFGREESCRVLRSARESVTCRESLRGVCDVVGELRELPRGVRAGGVVGRGPNDHLLPCSQKRRVHRVAIG